MKLDNHQLILLHQSRCSNKVHDLSISQRSMMSILEWSPLKMLQTSLHLSFTACRWRWFLTNTSRYYISFRTHWMINKLQTANFTCNLWTKKYKEVVENEIWGSHRARKGINVFAFRKSISGFVFGDKFGSFITNCARMTSRGLKHDRDPPVGHYSVNISPLFMYFRVN